MVALVQQLTLQRYLHLKQSLAALHDQIGAWSGLGQALLAFYRQGALVTNVTGVSCILLYLAGVSALHITTPALFSLNAVNVTLSADTYFSWVEPGQRIGCVLNVIHRSYDKLISLGILTYRHP